MIVGAATPRRFRIFDFGVNVIVLQRWLSLDKRVKMQSHKVDEREWSICKSETNYIINQSGKIAYNRVSGKNPGVVFLCGHGSDQEGSKALFIEVMGKKSWPSFFAV